MIRFSRLIKAQISQHVILALNCSMKKDRLLMAKVENHDHLACHLCEPESGNEMAS